MPIWLLVSIIIVSIIMGLLIGQLSVLKYLRDNKTLHSEGWVYSATRLINWRKS